MPQCRIDRSTWLAVYVGTLDAGFHLSEEELFGVTEVCRKLLQLLNIPDRAEAAALPLPVVLESSAQHYSSALANRDAGYQRPVRAITGRDCAASIEAWRDALISLITTSYPDLRPDERVLTMKVFTDLLASIGVPRRAAAFHPQYVLDASQQIDGMR